jgi:cytochrome c551/c552
MSKTTVLSGGLLAIGIAAGAYLPVVQAQDRSAVKPAVAATAPHVPDRAVVDRYCVSCHNDRLKTGGLSLDKIDIADAGVNSEVLEKVVRKLRAGLMPPEGRPKPDAATLEAFTASLETLLDRHASAAPNPGRVASRRLNRAEYVNVIHDLLALEVDGSGLLPSDMAGFGFDNNADVLSITPALMARYITAATKISRLAVASPDNRNSTSVYKVEFGTRQDARMGEDMPFGTHGGLAVRHTFPLDGDYTFSMRMVKDGTVSTIYGIEEDEQEIELRIDHTLVKRFKIGGKYKGPDPGVLIAIPEDDLDGAKIHDYRVNADKELQIRLPVKAGTRLITVGFTDSMPTFGGRMRGGGGGRSAGIDAVQIAGPFDAKAPEETPSRKQIFACRPAAARDEESPASAKASARPRRSSPEAQASEDGCARRIVTILSRRAYRRPVTARDVDPLMEIYREGRAERDFEFGIERAIEALLSSPKFLLRVETEPAGARPGGIYPLSDLELASRLSFFLWRSMPDDELLDVAARGALKTPAVLEQQVKRMLADRRALRFVDDFSEQWLQVRNMRNHDVDPVLFGAFDPTLRDAMLRETELFFQSQVREDRPIPELMTANYTFLNEQLAQHYGIADIYGSHFRRVTLTDERRFGLLGKASILAETSYSNRTSVVLRGKWILENLLGAPPPPPPPNVPPLKENKPGEKPAALRERMEQHRNNPVCASCHNRMDPLGFALEHFDAIGRWRENDGGAEINSTITLDGRTIDSPKAFREALVGRGHQFVSTVAEKMVTYALGRGVDYSDAPMIRRLVRDLEQHDYRWSSLVLGVIKSTPFQMRRVPAPEAAVTSAAASRQ